MIGCRRSNSGTGATCSRAVSEPNRISLLGNMLASSMPGSRVRGSTVRPTAHIQCVGRRRRRSTERLVTFERFSFCSKQRQTAHEHPIEGRIYYSFHPRCGETVLIVRRFAYRGVELVVIPQPDGSSACIPHLRSGHQQRRCFQPLFHSFYPCSPTHNAS